MLSIFSLCRLRGRGEGSGPRSIFTLFPQVNHLLFTSLSPSFHKFNILFSQVYHPTKLIIFLLPSYRTPSYLTPSYLTPSYHLLHRYSSGDMPKLLASSYYESSPDRNSPATTTTNNNNALSKKGKKKKKKKSKLTREDLLYLNDEELFVAETRFLPRAAGLMNLN